MSDPQAMMEEEALDRARLKNPDPTRLDLLESRLGILSVRVRDLEGLLERREEPEDLARLAAIGRATIGAILSPGADLEEAIRTAQPREVEEHVLALRDAPSGPSIRPALSARLEALGFEPGSMNPVVWAVRQLEDLSAPRGIRTVMVLSEVGDERTRQDARWGEQNHPSGTGEAWDKYASTVTASGHHIEQQARRILASGSPTYAAILMEEVGEALQETDPERLCEELIQVAAVAVAMVECERRRMARKGRISSAGSA